MNKTEADGSFAAALDPTNTLAGGIFAFKVNGADGPTLLGGIVEVEKSDLGAGATTRQATVGGKDVTVVSIGSGVNDTEWIYGRGDVVFVVHAAGRGARGRISRGNPGSRARDRVVTMTIPQRHVARLGRWR